MADKKGFDPIDFISKHWGEIYALAQMGSTAYGALKGKEPPEDAPPEVKAIARGIAGFGDEIDFIRDMLKGNGLEADEIAANEEFLLWHFITEPKKHHNGWTTSLICWYRMNQWRQLVTQLDSPPREVKSDETIDATFGKDGKTTKTTTKVKYRKAAGGKETKRFLKEIAAIMMADTPKTKPARCRKVLEHHLVRSVPTMPNKETLKWWGGLTNAQWVMDALSAAKTTGSEVTQGTNDFFVRRTEELRLRKQERKQRRQTRTMGALKSPVTLIRAMVARVSRVTARFKHRSTSS